MLVAFFTALIAAVVTQAAPGPNLLAVASVALSQGRNLAIMVAAGVATGVWIWVSICTMGVSALFARYPVSGDILRIVGGLYFIAISVRTLLAIKNSTDGLISAAKTPMSSGAAYRRGLMVVMTNPKAAFMWIAITAFLFGSGLNAMQVLWIAPAGSLTALLIYSCYGWLFSTSVARSTYQRLSSVFEWAFGILFGFLGLQLCYQGFHAVMESFRHTDGGNPLY